MPQIHQLPLSVVNKIAAGEVIERPASVLKELLENSVDAGARRIDVAVEQGGGELIRVADDGCGIAADQLPLAVASHATSKIESADDLFRVRTLGFRGEALASIAEVSRFVIRSRPADASSGAELEIVGGQPREVVPAGCPVGTTIEVRNLFFNTPVRQKFLRSTQTEMGHTIEALARLALAHPRIHFTLSHNGRMQYLLLNGRAIRDRALQHALSEAYRGLILTGRQPICFLRFEMPSELVDVNVHPTKQEVRFQDSGRLYSQLLGTLRTKFLTTDLTARGRSPAAGSSTTAGDESVEMTGSVSQLVRWAKEQLGQQVGDGARDAGSSSVTADRQTGERGTAEPLRLHRVDVSPFQPFDAEEVSRLPTPAPVRSEDASGRSTGRALQVHNRYLVAETEVGIEVIDQHALHERILYEQLREKVLGGALESQRLLVPEPVDLTATEAAAVLEQAELLAKLGVEVQPFGGETVLVSSYPAMLANWSPAEVLRELVEKLLAGGRVPEPRDLLDDLLHMIACKGAVKFGDRLSPEEIDALLAERHLAHDAHHCPHGRPTALVFTREELDRQFKRI